MPRLAPLAENAVPEMQPVLERQKQILGFVPNATLIMMRRPKVAAALGGLLAAIFAPESTVPGGFKRLVAFVASRAAGCQYCVAHQVGAALILGEDEKRVQAVWDYASSPLFSAKEKVALDYAFAAASVPNEVTDELFARLRAHWTDDDIVELTSVIGLFGFLNRFNDSMATPLEPTAIEEAEQHLGRARWSPGKHA